MSLKPRKNIWLSPKPEPWFATNTDGVFFMASVNSTLPAALVEISSALMVDTATGVLLPSATWITPDPISITSSKDAAA